MGSRILICGIVIVALAFAGANVYGQSSAALTSEVRYLDNNYNLNYHVVEIGFSDFSSIANGIDSVLNSLNLTRDDVMIFGASSVKNALIQSINSQKKSDKIASVDLENVLCYGKDELQPGYKKDSLIVNGRINYYANNKPSFIFSFQRMVRFGNPGSIDTLREDKSFWDSTAKPILVTLGAVAVIALFFLIRG